MYSKNDPDIFKFENMDKSLYKNRSKLKLMLMEEANDQKWRDRNKKEEVNKCGIKNL